MANNMQWNPVTFDPRGSSYFMRNAGESLSRAGTIFGNMAREETLRQDAVMKEVTDYVQNENELEDKRADRIYNIIQKEKDRQNDLEKQRESDKAAMDRVKEQEKNANYRARLQASVQRGAHKSSGKGTSNENITSFQAVNLDPDANKNDNSDSTPTPTPTSTTSTIPTSTSTTSKKNNPSSTKDTSPFNLNIELDSFNNLLPLNKDDTPSNSNDTSLNNNDTSSNSDNTPSVPSSTDDINKIVPTEDYQILVKDTGDTKVYRRVKNIVKRPVINEGEYRFSINENNENEDNRDEVLKKMQGMTPEQLHAFAQEHAPEVPLEPSEKEKLEKEIREKMNQSVDDHFQQPLKDITERYEKNMEKFDSIFYKDRYSNLKKRRITNIYQKNLEKEASNYAKNKLAYYKEQGLSNTEAIEKLNNDRVSLLEQYSDDPLHGQIVSSSIGKEITTLANNDKIIKKQEQSNNIKLHSVEFENAIVKNGGKINNGPLSHSDNKTGKQYIVLRDAKGNTAYEHPENVANTVRHIFKTSSTYGQAQKMLKEFIYTHPYVQFSNDQMSLVSSLFDIYYDLGNNDPNALMSQKSANVFVNNIMSAYEITKYQDEKVKTDTEMSKKLAEQNNHKNLMDNIDKVKRQYGISEDLALTKAANKGENPDMPEYVYGRGLLSRDINSRDSLIKVAKLLDVTSTVAQQKSGVKNGYYNIDKFVSSYSNHNRIWDDLNESYEQILTDSDNILNFINFLGDDTSLVYSIPNAKARKLFTLEAQSTFLSSYISRNLLSEEDKRRFALLSQRIQNEINAIRASK